MTSAPSCKRVRAPCPRTNATRRRASCTRGTRAAASYRKALALTRKEDPARPERLVLLAMALARTKTPEAARECVDLALRENDNTGATSIVTDFLAAGDHCASQLPEADRKRAELREKSIARVQGLLARTDVPLSVDDRSDAQASLMEWLDSSGQHDRALEVARARAKLLEQAAESAPDATMASTFDPHRTDTYLYLKQPEKAEQLLAEREKQMPDDFNPPARLARADPCSSASAT